MDHPETTKQQEALCKFNEEFIETLNELKDKKGKLKRKLSKDQKELTEIQKILDEKNIKKASLVSNIAKKNKQLETINTTIKNTQSAYQKIVETSQVLLTVIKKKAPKD
jgi:Sjoegren syndrome nuclear autoantigen 1